MPFGLKNAPTIFIRLIFSILGNKTFIELYFDDIIIHSKNFDDHLKHVKITLDLINKSSLKLQTLKCKWLAKILGHIVSKSHIEMDEDKIEPLKKRLAPVNIKQVQEFLGLCNYYRRFIKDFAKIALPLNDLLKKEKILCLGS